MLIHFYIFRSNKIYNHNGKIKWRNISLKLKMVFRKPEMNAFNEIPCNKMYAVSFHHTRELSKKIYSTRQKKKIKKNFLYHPTSVCV